MALEARAAAVVAVVAVEARVVVNILAKLAAFLAVVEGQQITKKIPALAQSGEFALFTLATFVNSLQHEQQTNKDIYVD
jgi:hypothetical protein